MGNILSFIKQIKDKNGGIPDLDEKYGVFLDFENEHLDFSHLSDEEKQMAEHIENKVMSALTLLEILRNYGPGGRPLIKEQIWARSQGPLLAIGQSYYKYEL